MGTGSERSKNMGIMGTWEHDCMGDGRYTGYHTVICGLAIGPERECRGLGLEQWSEQGVKCEV